MISIVIPIYNAELTLQACIDSILVQEYQDFEIILVDDGSKDDSPKICQIYSSRDNRIKYFRKENGGPSSARNLGLDNISGDLSCFIDSDDCVSPQYLSHLIAPFLSDPKIDVVIQNYGQSNIIEHEVILKDEAFKYYLVDHNIIHLCGPCAKLYKSEIIKNNSIFFPEESKMGEDFVFILRFFRYVKTAVVQPVNNYKIVETPNSLKKHFYLFESEYFTYKLLKENAIILFPEEESYVWEICGSTFIRATQSVFRTDQASYSISCQSRQLKTIDKEDLGFMLRNYHPKSLRLLVMKYLLVKHHLYLYCLIGSIDWKIRH